MITLSRSHILPFAVAGALLNAGITVSVRMLAATERTDTILIWQGMVMIAALAIPSWLWWVPPDATQWFWLIVLSLFGTAGQWLITRAYQVGEAAARPQTNSPTLAELSFPAMELYAMPAATQTLLDDAIVNIDQWIAEEVESAFAEQEGAAFVSGDGIDKPKGFLAYPMVAEASWNWGSIGVLNTGVAGAFATANPSDILVDLVYALKAGYRQNASFVMNRKTQGAVRKFKDSTGQYLWQPPASIGAPATLMGFPLVEAETMPDMANNAIALAFGDFRRGYLVVDRAGVRILRDPYSAKPYVLFYTTKRVGGGVQDFAAIKGLKFAV